MTIPQSFTTIQTLNGRGWDSNPQNPPSFSFKIQGEGFGQHKPDVILYDDFSLPLPDILGLDRQAVVGRWKNPISQEGSIPSLIFDEETNKKWFAIRDPQKLQESGQYRCGLYYQFDRDVTEFRISAKFWTPTGCNYPGSTSPATLPIPSSCKPIWLAQAGGTSISGTSFPNANLVFGSHTGGGSWNVLGNDVNPSWFDNDVRKTPSHKDSFERPTFKTYYQSGVEDSTPTPPLSETLMFVSVNGEQNRSYFSDQAYTLGEPNLTKRSYGALSLGSWMGNQPNSDYSNVQLYVGDIYLAIGEHSKACVILSDSPVLSESNVAKIIPPDTWTDSEITFSVSSEGLQYAHVMSSEGVLTEGLSIESNE